MTTAVPVLELRGERTRLGQLVKDFWAHRSLVSMLARQDYRSRYRSASLGLVWAVTMPMLQGIVIAVIFSHLVGGGSAKAYIPYVVTGVTLYTYFSTSLGSAATSIVDGAAIAGRIYFPRLVLPMVAPTANLPGLAVSTLLALGLTLGSGIDPTWWLLLAPAAGILTWLLVVSAGALLSIVHVYSRDIRYLVQAATLVLFYATPIIYLLDESGGARALPAGLRDYVIANPVTGVVQVNRLAITGHAAFVGPAVAVTACWIAVLVVATLLAYCRYERVACDRL
ncbi:MAG TPA: ABC transporter permease [Mycobacteriales bacterium]|nr:ABC transporter permease [Mycobacteriales bacterium]